MSLTVIGLDLSLTSTGAVVISPGGEGRVILTLRAWSSRSNSRARPDSNTSGSRSWH